MDLISVILPLFSKSIPERTKTAFSAVTFGFFFSNNIDDEKAG
jgi:hypothetical protein